MNAYETHTTYIRCAQCGAILETRPNYAKSHYFKQGKPVCSQACASAEWEQHNAKQRK